MGSAMIINFIHIRATEHEIRDLFGDIGGYIFTNLDRVILFDHLDKMEHLAVKAKFFPSLSQARKNGWSGFVPNGLTTGRFGKHKREYWVYNPNFWVEENPNMERM